MEVGNPLHELGEFYRRCIMCVLFGPLPLHNCSKGVSDQVNSEGCLMGGRKLPYVIVEVFIYLDSICCLQMSGRTVRAILKSVQSVAPHIPATSREVKGHGPVPKKKNGLPKIGNVG